MVTSERGRMMMGYLPPLYANSQAVQDLMQAEGSEFDALRNAQEEIKAQFFARTATWDLAEWEQQLALPFDPSLTDPERQDRIMSRLRGTGTCTVVVAKQVAESYKYGAIDVVEDHAGYTILVLFVDRTGIPSNLPDLQAAVRAVVPAHLGIQYVFNFFTYAELDAKGWTWNELDALGLTWDELETYS